jgi:hypothetical protein
MGADFILWAIFGVGINGAIGYMIGKSKNDVRDSILITVLLGPIGWLISLIDKGNLRNCPFCAEEIKPDAKVCRHCERDLPAPTSAGSR